MSHAYVIEIDEVSVGVVVRQREIDGGRRYCFYSANTPFHSIEGKLFSTPEKARKAAIALMAQARKPSAVTVPHN